MGLNFYKKIGLCLALLSGASIGASAQNLLDENFDGAFPPSGWTVVNSNLPGAVTHWDKFTDSSHTGVYVNRYKSSEPIKEEQLLTPWVTLNGYYDLNFLWQGATAASIKQWEGKPEYDFQVRVKTDGSDSWTTIFSFLDEDMVRNSGVAWPWEMWKWNSSSINLTDWQGKKVQFAFVVLKLRENVEGNGLWLDDVSITPSKQITGPIAEVTPTTYVFGDTYVDTKKYSELFTLKNTGRDVLKVTGVNGLNGTDFGCTLDPSEVALKTGDTYQFQFWYLPTVSGAGSATATIATNGGDVKVALSGRKRVVPEGSKYEGFEEMTFPPLGWTRKGSGWYRYNYGLTGDASAACVFPDAESSIISPRLDLSSADAQQLRFTYFEEYDPTFDDSSIANFFRVYLSTDGGNKWTQIFDSYTSYTEDGDLYNTNTIYNVTLNLPASSGDNCYVKFTSEIPGFSMSSFDDVPDYSMVYIDDVLLPTLYGSAGAPESSKAVNPVNDATNVYHKNLTLEWTGALFATNYKLYLGTSPSNFEVLNGIDMGTATSYEVARLDYNTKYYWKVVAYNGTVENTAAPIWNFTVMPDQSVTTLPYSVNFDDGFPLGWNNVPEGYTRWQLSDWMPFGGDGKTPMASGSNLGSKAILESPEIFIPESGDALVSFVWGNAAPSGLKTDATGQMVNNTKEPNDQSAIFFDVEVDGQWKNLALLSDKSENPYWYRESFSLKDYAGKFVAFRFRYEVYGYSANNASVDNFLVEGVSDDKAMAAFNFSTWDAGYVNNGEKVTSRNPILLSNIGVSPLRVRGVQFTTPNFSSSLAAGTSIEPNRSASFAITYNSGTNAGEVADEMLVTFENGTSISLPVKGTTLASDVFYYDFEGDEHASTQPRDFTTVDRDGYATVMPVLIYYPKRGAPFAYIVLNCTGDYADWRNVYPVSGEQVLASMSESTSTMNTDDWIISPKLLATDKSQFRFYAKCYGDADQVFSQNRIEVLVSTTDKEIASFETVMASTKLPWSGSEGKWTEYTVDLSKYAGQPVYIALRHTTDKDGFVSFFDDFWFENFAERLSGVEGITIESVPASAELYDLNGLKVNRENAVPGIYILRSAGKTEKVVIR